MSATQEQIEKLKTLQESYDAVATAIETQLPVLADKIDNIKLPEIDTTELAKQGENQEATNSAIYALLSQFGESVLQEVVTVICNCAEDIAWEEYGVVITYADGTSQSLPMSENGTCSFSVKIGQEYSVQLPVIGAYIAPTLKTYMASTSSRQIYWSYVVSGVFGLDELGRRYTIEQIEALEDKSIIKYGGFTNEYLENYQRADGGVGCGFMWDLNTDSTKFNWASSNIAFDENLLPFPGSESNALMYCDGEAYTTYIISEGLRLGVTTNAASACAKKTLSVKGDVKKGYLPAYGQLRRLMSNKVAMDKLYTLTGYAVPPYDTLRAWVSAQKNSTQAICIGKGDMYWSDNKNGVYCFAFTIFNLP